MTFERLQQTDIPETWKFLWSPYTAALWAGIDRQIIGFCTMYQVAAISSRVYVGFLPTEHFRPRHVRSLRQWLFAQHAGAGRPELFAHVEHPDSRFVSFARFMGFEPVGGIEWRFSPQSQP